MLDEKLTKIHQWLHAPDPSTNYHKALKQRQIDTGLWFLESKRYVQWKTDAASTLWLYGIPGCGKTFLSSAVIQDVLQHCDDDPGKVVAYFYFDFDDVEKQYPEAMVRSLICQLSYQCVEIPACLDLLFSACEDGRQPSSDALLDVVQHMIQEFPQAYIILDALDECANEDALLTILETMAGWQLLNLRLLVTSRPEGDIEWSLEGFVPTQNMISLHTELFDEDIQKYVRERLSDDNSLPKWQRVPNIRREIEIAVTKGANGMYFGPPASPESSIADQSHHRFRWAVCQLDRLAKCHSRSALQEVLATQPPALDKTYDRILCAIDERNSKYAVRVLLWLAFSSRQLSPEEISEAVAIDVERDPSFDMQEVLEDPLDVLKICPSLVTIANNKLDSMEESPFREWMGEEWTPWPKMVRQVVVLAHYSVKEYLTSERIRQGPAARYSMQDAACNEVLAKSCLGYLLQFQRPDSLSKDNIKGFKLARYSAEFWISHVRAAVEESKTLRQVIMKLFETKGGAFLNWIRVYDPDHGSRDPDLTKPLESIPAPLYYASRAGLAEIVSRLLLESGSDVTAEGGHYGNALQVASTHGHTEVVELLLSKGADVSAKAGYYSSALHAASHQGHDKIVKLLLSKGADVNTKGREWGSSLDTASAINALQAASVKGFVKIVELLLSQGAEVGAEGGSYGSALQAASMKGHEQIVKLLLSKGAEVNAKGGVCGSALQGASMGGHEKTVKLLLSKGAEVNAKGGEYGNALQLASWLGHEKVVEVLLSGGAEVNVQGECVWSNALFAASGEGHGKVRQLLISNGAEVDILRQEECVYGSALQRASGQGHEKIVELLLSNGAEVNAEGSNGNALEVASLFGRGKIVRLLVSKGAKVNEKALQDASRNGHDKVVELLLSKTADVNVKGNCTTAAEYRSHLEEVWERFLDECLVD